jgi:hypothetical protein
MRPNIGDRECRPDRAIAELVVADTPDERTPQRRTHPTCIDDEIVGAVMATEPVDHDRALARMSFDTKSLDASRDRDAKAHDLVVEQREEASAMDAEPEEMRTKSPVVYGEHAPATDRAPFEIMDDGAERDRPLIEAELRKTGEPGRLQQQAGAHRTRFGETLEQVNIMAVAGEESRRRKPTRAGADDAYPQVPHGAHQAGER